MEELVAFINKRSQGNTDQFLQRLRNEVPKATLSVRCWHDEQIKVKEKVYDENKRKYKKQIRYEDRTVETYYEQKDFIITQIFDQTLPLAIHNYQQVSMIHLQLLKDISWMGDSQRMVEFYKKQLYNDNVGRDQQCEVRFQLQLPGFTEHNLLEMHNQQEWYLNWFVLLIATLLHCEPIAVAMIRQKVPKTKLIVKKFISIEPVEKQQPNQHVPIVLENNQTFYENDGQFIQPHVVQQNNNPLLVEPPLFPNLDYQNQQKLDQQNNQANNIII